MGIGLAEMLSRVVVIEFWHGFIDQNYIRLQSTSWKPVKCIQAPVVYICKQLKLMSGMVQFQNG